MSEPYAISEFRYRSRARCLEHALVLHALGIDYGLAERGTELILWVPAEQAERAREQIELYRRENEGGPPRGQTYPIRDSGLPGVAGYTLVLVLMAYLQTREFGGLDWYGAGKVQVGLIRDGEWWRTFTALGLHLDLPHLIGNLVFGALFGLAAGQALGSGAAWLCILIAGALGNALNAAVQSPTHAAVGASTAVFAGLGIIAVYFWRQQRHMGGRWATRWGPVVAGVVLLAFLGVGGERTDITAHLTGFVSGGLLGAVCGKLEEEGRLRRASQRVLGSLAAVLFAAAWFFALTRHG